MSDRRGDTTVTIEAAGDRRTIELPTGFVEFIRESGESAADVVAGAAMAVMNHNGPYDCSSGASVVRPGRPRR